MKLEKTNKYARKKAIGIGSVILSMTLLMSACGLTSAKEEIHPEEPTSAMATVMPTSTPKLTPRPTPIPELSHEEELELLGMINPMYINDFCIYLMVIYEQNNIKKVSFAYTTANDKETTIYDCFTEQQMFKGKNPTGGFVFKEIFQDYEPANDRLINAKVIDGDMLRYIPEILIDNDIEMRDLEEFNAFLNENIPTDDVIVAKQMIAELYLLSIPKEYRVTAAELDPNYSMEETPKVK